MIHNFIIVMADGFTSFYTNMKYGGQYFDFFDSELFAVLDTQFNLPKDRYIVGQSMGGYRAVKLGLSSPEKYKTIGCFSGGLDAKELVKTTSSINSNGELNAVFGDQAVIEEKDDCFALAKKVKEEGKEIPLIMYCGTDDFIYQMSEDYDAYLNEIGYEHVYHKGQGRHMWDYWDREMPNMMEELCKI